MNAIDIQNELKKYKKGWVALSPENKVVEYALNFKSICEKLNKHKNKENFLIIPASENYFGFIT